MSIHNKLVQDRGAKAVIPDPGNGQSIRLTKNGQCLVRTTAGSGTETRKLARPSSLNQELTIVFLAKTVNFSISADGGFFIPGVGQFPTLSFITASFGGPSWLLLRAYQQGSVKGWMVIMSDLIT